MEITVESGNYEVIGSSMVILYDLTSEMRIHLTEKHEHFGDIIIHFISRANSKNTIEANLQNDDLILDCVNFDNALGTGTIIPLEIGTINGKKLKLHLWSYYIGNESVRKVEYTLFKER